MACRDMLVGVGVRDVMRPCADFVGSADMVTRARALMRSKGLRSLPVVDGGKISGVITVREVMQVTSSRSNIPVSGVMLPSFLFATPEMGLSELAKQMVDREVSDVPVVQSRGEKTVVGLVKFDDVLGRIADKVPPRVLVREVMVEKVVTCEPEDEIPKIWDMMEKTNYTGIPVIRRDKRRRINEVLGVITRMDIISSGTTRLSEESDKGRFKTPPKVKSVMRTPAIVVSPETPLAEAIDLMVRKDVGRLPVVENENLVGIVSRYDIIQLACG